LSSKTHPQPSNNMIKLKITSLSCTVENYTWLTIH
jgi:hypothetical protein